MNKKTYTFLVTSNRKGATNSLTLSSAWIKTMLALAAIGFVVLGAIAVDYVGLLLEAGESKRLRVENVQLKKQFEVVESKVQSLESSLERVKSFSTKLKLITNIDDQDRVMKLALGPMPRPGQDMHGTDSGHGGSGSHDFAMDSAPQGNLDRKPSSEFLVKDDLFMQRPPLDEAAGELSKLNQTGYASLSIRIDEAVRETELREQGILELWGTLSERQSLLNATPNIKPARGWYTSRFGYRLDPYTGKPVMHAGLDIAAPPGTPVYATADGVIAGVSYEAGYGKLVVIDHGYGVKTRYAHNSQVFVEVGQKVKRYEVVAAVGNTGRSTGPHVHYEVRVHGVPVDPINYVLEE